jgi:hypothetical protein
MRLTPLFFCLLLSCKGELAEIDKLADEVCACKDVPCGEEKMKTLGDLAQKLSSGKSDKALKALADKIEEQRARMKKCIDEIRGDAGPPPPDGEEFPPAEE